MKRETLWLLIGLGALLLLGGGGVALYQMTRGLRLNNPGNIFYNPNNAWAGQIVPSTDPELAQFSTLLYGIRAIGHTLASYSAEGFNTVDSIIRRYSATDQDAYVANVSSALGVDPGATIDPTDPNTRFALVRAIINQEQGSIPAMTISDNTVAQGLAMA
jgi:hypothetical protein